MTTDRDHADALATPRYHARYDSLTPLVYGEDDRRPVAQSDAGAGLAFTVILTTVAMGLLFAPVLAVAYVIGRMP
jgi:hypothetical protein